MKLPGAHRSMVGGAILKQHSPQGNVHELNSLHPLEGGHNCPVVDVPAEFQASLQPLLAKGRQRILQSRQSQGSVQGKSCHRGGRSAGRPQLRKSGKCAREKPPGRSLQSNWQAALCLWQVASSTKLEVKFRTTHCTRKDLVIPCLEGM